jgi:hypothetical protein
VHNKLNHTHLALMHFSWAMDIDPKVANSQIKDALDPAVNRCRLNEKVSGKTYKASIFKVLDLIAF